MRTILHVLATSLSVLLFSASLFAQGNFGRILGTVTDQTGAVLPGAKVTVLDTERGIARALTTDAAGEYNAPTLIPGTYTVRVEASGFKRLDRQNVLRLGIVGTVVRQAPDGSWAIFPSEPFGGPLSMNGLAKSVE
ncbi:MAG TPA: carboxypeptidase-like regulatory domain-containing protein [Bryobacteraceae bacterium]|nr:carboxypeptidase-like regulatory domain-containing protein [Bryobacteraceae bacterium]